MEQTLKDSVEDSKRENDFKLISDELKRHFDLLMRVDDSHNVKAGIILGFIMLIIVQITLSTEYTNLLSAKPIAFIIFAIGFVAILFSFAFGIAAVYPQTYKFGYKVAQLTQEWKDNKQKDYAKNIFGKMFIDYNNDKRIIQRRAELIRLMLALFSFGLVFIILSRIAPW
jgi:ABC-type transport system involved in multi-copper enzyme maturation permease subunit